MELSLYLYFVALCAQMIAAIYAVNIFFRAKAYRLACGFLALGFSLMVGRRIYPILHLWAGGLPSLTDAWLSVLISALLLLGMFQFRNLLIDLEDQSFILSQFLKFDALTGAMSRVETFFRVELEIQKCFRSKKCIAFLMADIDHFKAVNDLYGHPIGDQVLVNLVKVCKDELREIDIFGRVGGGEFLIVLPETNLSQSMEIANRLRLRVAEKPMAYVNQQDIFITMSIGIALLDPCIEKEGSSNTLLKKYYSFCDEAMYRAKEAGRNQVSA